MDIVGMALIAISWNHIKLMFGYLVKCNLTKNKMPVSRGWQKHLNNKIIHWTRSMPRAQEKSRIVCGFNFF